MASERDLELLDDYLGNRLNADQKVAFEKALSKDADLNKEYMLQKHLVEGLKKARVAELKQMLGNVPVPPIPQGGPASLVQIGTMVVVAGLVGTGLFYYLREDKEVTAPAAKKELTTPQPEQIQPLDVPKTEPQVKDTQTAEKAKEAVKPQPSENRDAVSDSGKTDDKAITPGVRDVFDPSEDAKSSEQSTAIDEVKSSAAVTPSIAMETVSNARYHFHYQFKENKLFLYGVFEKNLYEIMEFFSNNKRTVFLYYKNNYYLLNEEKDQVTPLVAITDEALLKKLKDYRAKR